VNQYGRILQVGSQQRSDARFRFAAELVRNGRIGKLHTVKVGFGKDPFGGIAEVTPVPPELDYEIWVGPAAFTPYIRDRVHPVESYSRPGWLRTDDFCCGMITGWGSHHMDSAHWGMGTEHTGPLTIDGIAEYSTDGVWDAHGAFRIDYTYPDDVTLICADTAINKQGVVFEGSEGCNFLECIRTRKAPVAPVEIGHRSNSACILGYISMKLNRKINWDHKSELITGDAIANRMTARPYRSPWHL